jgi:hypothetical protein
MRRKCYFCDNLSDYKLTIIDNNNELSTHFVCGECAYYRFIVNYNLYKKLKKYSLLRKL